MHKKRSNPNDPPSNYIYLTRHQSTIKGWRSKCSKVIIPRLSYYYYFLKIMRGKTFIC